ncbi:MAG TPA: metallophosphoesterase family protein [Cytophagaceae bacterium]|jgi:putative phosphoesterase|nr:metallophosphoesterase family protein [Cytophagaceae bacterium]
MPKIGLISDTHGFLDPKVFDYFKECDEIWHAGDFGTLQLSDQLSVFKPLRGVYGNIDGHELRAVHPLHNRFSIGGMEVWMTHIGGYPGRYNPEIMKELKENPPHLFICGHSHILKVVSDKNLRNMLCINPGAAGIHGFHSVKTIIRFDIKEGKISNMQAIELGKRSEIL